MRRPRDGRADRVFDLRGAALLIDRHVCLGFGIARGASHTTMDDESLAELAREYGLDSGAYGDAYLDDPVVEYSQPRDYQRYSMYDDIEDYMEEPGNVSNFCSFAPEIRPLLKPKSLSFISVPSRTPFTFLSRGYTIPPQSTHVRRRL